MDVGKHAQPPSHLKSVLKQLATNEAMADGVEGLCPADGDVESFVCCLSVLFVWFSDNLSIQTKSAGTGLCE